MIGLTALLFLQRHFLRNRKTICGPDSSGKTTLTLQVIDEAQKLGGTAAFVNAEHALDPVYAQKLGVNMDDLLVSQPDTGEQALEITDMLVRSSVVVVDSVAALTPKAEIEAQLRANLLPLADETAVAEEAALEKA